MLTEKKGWSFGGCSAWKGGNELPWGRKGFPRRPRVEGSYTE